MYSFRDTTASEASAGTLPSEALKINSVYIENQIQGYRTLAVSGREALSPEVKTYDTGTRDGSTIKSRRYPERTITVKYQLITDSPENFRKAYNKLAGILNVEDAELIFNDEKDKFFIGTPCAIGDVEPGLKAVVGEFDILCADPFKYSVTEYVAQNDLLANSISINYGGTYRAFPVLEVDFFKGSENDTAAINGGDCGFVSFFTENGSIIQIGDPEEVDGVYDANLRSQDLIVEVLSGADSWSSAQGRWTLNDAGPLLGKSTQTGSVGMVIAQSMDPRYHLSAADYGTGTGYHGPTIKRAIPADASGEVGAKDFGLTMYIKMTGGVAQYGGFGAYLTEQDGSVLAAIRVCKSQKGTTWANLELYVNGTLRQMIPFCTLEDEWFAKDYDTGTMKFTTQIRKTGNQIWFALGGMKNYYITDNAITNKKAMNVVYGWEKYGTEDSPANNGVRQIKFIKHNCDTFREIPNKFNINDILIADCRTGEISLNGNFVPEIGALGNNWEEFYLTPGLNQIGVACSEWVPSAYRPTFKVKYREVFL